MNLENKYLLLQATTWCRLIVGTLLLFGCSCVKINIHKWDGNISFQHLNQFLEILFLFVRIFHSWKHIRKWKESKRILYSLQTKRSHLRAKTVGFISNNGSKYHWPQNWYYYRLVWIICSSIKDSFHLDKLNLPFLLWQTTKHQW